MAVGILSLLIQPIFNIPDEVAHFARAERISRGKIFVDPKQQSFDSIQALYDLHENINKPIIGSSIIGKKIDYTPTTCAHIAASNLSIFYFPQAFGILIAKILKLDTIWLLWMGRFTNLIVYSLLISLAIKIAPKMKFLLFFVSVLPMSIQQAASMNPDAIINGLSLFLIALFLNLYDKNRETIMIKEIVMYSLIAIFMTVSKLSLICIAGLFLLLPLEKVEDKNIGKRKGILIKVAVIGSVIIIGVIYYLYTTTFAQNLEQMEYLISNHVDSALQMKYILSHPLKWMHNFGGFLINHVTTYIEMLNNFGWLSYSYPLITSVSLFMFGKLCFQDDGIDIKLFNKFLIFLMILGTYGITGLALYLSWTPVGSATVDGIQGRYFIPIIPLIALLFTSEREQIEENHTADVAVSLFMVGAMLIETSALYY